MKVCAVTTWPPHRDGVALYSSDLYSHLEQLVRVTILGNLPDEPDAYSPHNDEDKQVLRCWKRGSFSYPLQIFRSAFQERPHLLHLHHGWLLYGKVIPSSLFLVLLLLFRISRKPCVVTMHTVIKRRAQIYDNPLYNLLARMAIIFVSRFIVKVADRVIVHNSFMKTILQREYALRDEGSKIVVIPHGVKKPSTQPQTHQKEKNVWILSLGFLRKSKVIAHLIQAFENLLETAPHAKLVIVGGRHAHDKTSFTPSFKPLLTPTIRKNLFFTGFLNEQALDALIWRSTIIVLQSTEQYFVEASGSICRVAGYAKPIICSKVPKFQSELQDGEDCLMTTPSDLPELTQALLSLTTNPQLRTRLGDNLRKKFENNDWAAVAKRHVKLYTSLLSLKTTPGALIRSRQ
jgi:glycosyltransferase involved in cell wall biosynthesis